MESKEKKKHIFENLVGKISNKFN